MKKTLVSTILASVAFAAVAQSSVDAYRLSQSDLRGTARFMSMAGAFTALGGDLSTLSQNPAGIGVYRRSEVGLTLDINMTHSNASTPVGNFTEDHTHVYCNNFGYIGSVALNSDVMYTFNWGASYNRSVSFDRSFMMGAGNNTPGISTSLSNYIAGFTNQSNVTAGELNADQDNYNPYQEGIDWLSILAYNSYMINPVPVPGMNPNDYNKYAGLWGDNTSGSMAAWVRERGYVDEYNLDFGGNVMDMVYWGVGFGITDLNYTQESLYTEYLTNANIPNASADGIEKGDGDFDLYNQKRVTGTGFNFKLGVIVKPVNELRLGFAVHTPTYYSLSQDFYADTYFNYSSGYRDRTSQTDPGYFDWKLRSPWKIMFGVAGVIGGRGIISVDYQRDAYDNMRISDRGAYFNYDAENGDIKNYFQATNTIRVGGELRVTPNFSLRAGYSYSQSAVKSETENAEIYTSGTNPAFTFDKDTQYVTLGLGYRYQAFYADAAYVFKQTKSDYHAFTDYAGIRAPQYDFTNTNNNIVLSIGFKF